MSDAAPTAGRPDFVRLTVVIPHFNHIDFLPRALFSVVDQELDGLEILIVDDGSSQDCQPELDRLAASHPAIRLLRHDANRGAAAALNTGLGAARGEMISFLGADDLALPGLYETMAAALERYPDAGLACGEIAIVGDDATVRGIRPMTPPAFRECTLPGAEVRRRLHRTDNWICNTATVYRTAVVREIGGFDESLGAFCDGFAVRLIAFAHGFVFVPGIYGIWRVAAETLSASSALDDGRGAKLLETVEAAMAASQIAKRAPEYPAIFSRRIRFSAARMHFVWNGPDADPDSIWKVSGLGDGDRRVLAAIKASTGFGGFGRLVAIGWLAVRLRPLSPAAFVACTLRNRMLLWANTKRVKAQVRRTELLAKRLTQGREAA